MKLLEAEKRELDKIPKKMYYLEKKVKINTANSGKSADDE